MTEVIHSQLLFVNSETTLPGSSCVNVNMNLPQSLAACEPHQEMRMTLSSFTMRKNWYAVNSGNRAFYVVKKPAGAASVIANQILIDIGNYESFSDADYGLAAAIKTALQRDIQNAPISLSATEAAKITCTFQYISNTFKIEVPGLDCKIVCFTIPEYAIGKSAFLQRIIGYNFESAFTSTNELLGGCNQDSIIPYVAGKTDLQYWEELKSWGTIENAGSAVAPFESHTGKWAASLSTEEEIYLRCDQQMSNYQTAGFDAGAYDLYPFITSSQILAKIPLGMPQVSEYTVGINNASPPVIQERYISEKSPPVITYLDNGDNLYSTRLASKNISQLRLFLTDSYGRKLPVSQAQLDCDSSAFTATIKIDILA